MILIKTKRKLKQMCRNKKFKENYSLLIQTNIHYKFIILLNAFFKQALSVRKYSQCNLMHQKFIIIFHKSKFFLVKHEIFLKDKILPATPTR